MNTSIKMRLLFSGGGQTLAAAIESLAPYHWWRFQETTGDALDSGSASALDGTLSGTIVRGEAGPIASDLAYEFDGVTADIDLAAGDLTTNSDHTLAMLVYIPTGAAGQIFVGNSSVASGDHRHKLEYSDSRILAEYNLPTTTAYRRCDPPPVDTWLWMFVPFDLSALEFPAIYYGYNNQIVTPSTQQDQTGAGAWSPTTNDKKFSNTNLAFTMSEFFTVNKILSNSEMLTLVQAAGV